MSRVFKAQVKAAGLVVFTALLLVACGDGGQPSESTQAEATAPPANQAKSPSSLSTSSPPLFPQTRDTEAPIELPPEVPEEFAILYEAWQLLLRDFVEREKLDPEAFSEAALRGMLRVLEDPQTHYVSPEVMAASFRDTFTGEFEGIGAHVSMNAAGKLLIVAPIEGSPAQAAGLKAGDIILEADGKSLDGMSLLESVALIRGPEGSTLTLLVKRLSVLDPFEVDVTRGVIPLFSVYLRSEDDDRYAHIRISQFFPNTVDALKEMVTKALEGGAQGIILDVRDNPGGTLDGVVSVASQFLDDGLVLTVINADGERTEWPVRKGGVAKEIPLVVLVNEGSASSSEVLVGALQDHQRAKVIGTTSYGKGSVNWLRNLSNGGGLYITIARWYTPTGRLIQDLGIEPDIEIAHRDAREADVKQLECAVELLDQMTGIGGPQEPCT